MTVRVEIKQTTLYCGEVDITKERFLKFQKTLEDEDKEMQVISVMLMKGLHKTEEWSIDEFLNLSGTTGNKE